MAGQDKPVDIRVSVSLNAAEASIFVPADFPREHLTIGYCRQKLTEVGVRLGADVSDALDHFLGTAPPTGQAVTAIIARREPPVHGIDGRIDWIVENETQPEAAPRRQGASDAAGHPASATGDALQMMDHYSKSPYIMVTCGQTIGRVIAPVPGIDGVDVTGRALIAKSGRPAVVQTDDSIMQLADGTLQARIDGILHRTGNKARICRRLEVDGYVDFSTGNIDFQGDVLIHRGVRDCFEVKASNNIEARGLIEAATIEAGGDLNAQGGMAGRERGKVRVGRHLMGKYLDNIQGDVKGDLKIDREVINCSLTVGGAIRMPDAAIIGGSVTVAGAAEVAEVGSSAGTHTTMTLGSVPGHEIALGKIESILSQLASKRDELLSEQQSLKTNSRFLSSTQKERITEVMFDIHHVDGIIAKARFAMNRLDEEINKRRTVSFKINRQINHGVVLVIRDQQFRIVEETRGPLQVCLDAKGHAIFQRGESVMPLASIARVSAAGSRSLP